jgi:hypothetical protein
MSLEELEKRIKLTEDIEEIKQLQFRYINCLNFSKWDEITECFSENIELDLGEGSEKGRVIQGKTEIGRLFKETISRVHTGKEGLFIVHPIIAVEGDNASGTWTSYFMHIRSKGEDPLLHWMQGIYNCKYVREKGNWKIGVLKWRSRLKYRQSQMMVIE